MFELRIKLLNGAVLEYLCVSEDEGLGVLLTVRGIRDYTLSKL
jgi:hypothetical protein